jgi:predicted metal-dependent hydrolase
VCQFRDTDARERLWQAVNILGKVKDHLAKIVRDGKLAQREIDQLAQRRKRFGIV